MNPACPLRIAAIVALAVLAAALGSNACAQAPTAQQNAARQATRELERAGALVMRDLVKNFGLDDERSRALKERLDETAAAYVAKNPPPVLEWGGPPPIDIQRVLELPAWREALQKALDAKELEAYDAFLADRKARLEAAATEYVRALMAAEFRLSAAQRKAVGGLVERFAKKELETVSPNDWWGGSQICRRFADADQQGDRVLTAAQVRSGGQARGRNPGIDFSLEAERVKLVCGLDEKASRLLAAAGAKAAREQKAVLAKKAADEAKARAEAKKAKALAKENGGDDLPEDEESPEEETPKADPPSVLDDPFWRKARDSIVDAEKLKLLAADVVVDIAAVRAARSALALVQLEELLHLDKKQVEAVKELVARQIAAKTTLGAPAALFALDGFGVKEPKSQYYDRSVDAKTRAARKALEDLLDRDQLDFLKDRIIL